MTLQHSNSTSFQDAFLRMIENEGGYVLHEVKGDRGGMTFAGIARNFHGSWEGWGLIDSGDYDSERLRNMVKGFYCRNFWGPIKGDAIESAAIARSIFDFAVNAGVRTASRLAQKVVGATADGVIGGKTIEAINKWRGDEFIACYALAKISRYAAICNRDRSQVKFLLGWVNRTLKGARL